MKTHTFFLKLIRFRLRYFALGQICITLYYVSLAFSGLIVRAFFERLSGEAMTLSLLMIVGLQAANTLLTMIGLNGANYFGFFFHHASRALLFKNMLQRILQMPGARALPVRENISVGTAVNIFRDDVDQSLDWTVEIGDFLGLVLTAVVAFWVMLRVSVLIALGTFVPLIVIVLLVERLSKRIERYRQTTRETTGQVTGAIGEIFGAVQAIQVNHAETRVIAHFRKLNDRRRQAMLKDQLLTRLINALAENTVTIGTGLVLILAAREMWLGRFSVGDFALFVAYIWPVTELLRSTGVVIAGYQQAGVSITRMQLLMQGAPLQALTIHSPVHLTGRLPAIPHIPKLPEHQFDLLDVRGLSHRYQGRSAENQSIPGIEKIDLSLSRGSFTVITGRIGAGKSTLLRVLLGLLPKDTGEIRWNGKLVQNSELFFTPPRIAYTPQAPRLFSETLRDNILMGLPVNGADLDDAIRLAVLSDDIATMDRGLNTLVGSRGLRLSGGQAQRTAAARMFVRQPELLVFDDLSSALDIETEKRLWERLFAQDGVTCLAVSHRAPALRRADQIVVLREGRVIDVGTLDELLARCEDIQQILDSHRHQ